MTSISPEELQEINDLRTKLSITVTEVGQLTLQSEILKSDLEELSNRMSEQTIAFKQLLEQEQVLIKRLSEKYGTGSINFETGEFTPER